MLYSPDTILSRAAGLASCYHAPNAPGGWQVVPEMQSYLQSKAMVHRKKSVSWGRP